MASDNELRLLSKAVRDRDISKLLEAGIADDWFFVEENKQVWKFIKQHWTKYQEVPTAVTVKDNFPTYTLLAVEDTIEYLLDQLIDYRRRQNTISLLLDAQEAVASGGHDAALNVMGQRLAQIVDEGSRQSSDVDLTNNPMQRFDEYLAVKTRPNGLIGVSTGFKTIDEATAGLQPGQLVTIIAPPKTGKSVLALQTAVNVHKDGYVPMFQSFEMTNEEQKHRHDAMRCGISHARLTRGGLKPQEEDKYRKGLQAMESMHKFYLTDSISALTVTGIAAKIDKLQPDIVFIDGVYLMIDEVTGDQNTPGALTNITRALKQLAQKKKIPVVISTQVLTWKMKGKKVTADSIGYSSSFYQDSDVILALQRQDEEDDTSRELRIVASRNCGPAATDLLWDWEEGRFEEYGAFGQSI